MRREQLFSRIRAPACADRPGCRDRPDRATLGSPALALPQHGFDLAHQEAGVCPRSLSCRIPDCFPRLHRRKPHGRAHQLHRSLPHPWHHSCSSSQRAAHTAAGTQCPSARNSRPIMRRGTGLQSYETDSSAKNPAPAPGAASCADPLCPHRGLETPTLPEVTCHGRHSSGLFNTLQYGSS